MPRYTRLLALLSVSLTASVAFAQFPIPSKINEKVKQRIEQKQDSLIDKGINKVDCAVTDQKCIDDAKAAKKDVVLTDAKGKRLPDNQQPKAQQQAAGGEAAQAGDAAWANFDFVPGEKVLFKDDYMSDRVGNFPHRLEFISGNAEMVTWKGSRWLRINSTSVFAVPLPSVLPDRFTMEFPITLPWWGMQVYGGPDGNPSSPSDRKFSWIVISCCEVGVKLASRDGGSVSDPRKATGVSDIDGHLFTVRVQGDGKYLKVYLDQTRVANIPTADFKRTNKIYFQIRPSNDTSIFVGPISINAGGQTMYDALSAAGRFATQGIYFDTGSDVVRGESTPTLQDIADMLKEHPDLKLRIEGHTDNVGDAAANQTLSEKRAAAVKLYLVSKLGIDAARLEAQGFGATKPIGPNDTPEGRQNNRRVELVKLNK